MAAHLGLFEAYSSRTGWQPSGPPAPVYVSVPPTNGMAIAALILVFVFYPIGIVLGHVARGQIKRTGEGGRGLATAALVIGYLQVAVTVGIIAVAAFLVAVGAQQAPFAGRERGDAAGGKALALLAGRARRSCAAPVTRVPPERTTSS